MSSLGLPSLLYELKERSNLQGCLPYGSNTSLRRRKLDLNVLWMNILYVGSTSFVGVLFAVSGNCMRSFICRETPRAKYGYYIVLSPALNQFFFVGDFCLTTMFPPLPTLLPLPLSEVPSPWWRRLMISYHVPI